jgi:hypothetical protein
MLRPHRSGGPDTEQALLTVSVQEYGVADVRAVFGERCVLNRPDGLCCDR